MSPHDELFQLATKLSSAATAADAPEIKRPTDALEKAAKEIGRSFSGSWLGYHSRVYYAGLSPTPPGAHFSQEWGLSGDEWLGLGSRGDWREYDRDSVLKAIHERAHAPDLTAARRVGRESEALFRSSKSEILSILSNELGANSDSYLDGLRKELDALMPLSKADVASTPPIRFY